MAIDSGYVGDESALTMKKKERSNANWVAVGIYHTIHLLLFIISSY